MLHAAPGKETPQFNHALIMGALALVIALFLATGYAWDLTARVSTDVLNASGIATQYVSPLYLLYVRLLDGTIAGFQVLIECSGLITLAVFSFISTFTIGLLRGSLTVKMLWFALSITIGLAWNLSRLVFVVAVAYSYGFQAFSFVHYVLAPTIDFIWIVSMWGLGMSRLRKEEKAE